jgi:hypothetical protein
VKTDGRSYRCDFSHTCFRFPHSVRSCCFAFGQIRGTELKFSNYVKILYLLNVKILFLFSKKTTPSPYLCQVSFLMFLAPYQAGCILCLIVQEVIRIYNKKRKCLRPFSGKCLTSWFYNSNYFYMRRARKPYRGSIHHAMNRELAGLKIFKNFRERKILPKPINSEWYMCVISLS